ncbi:pyridoxal phosphate-dependent decarboxylase family protein [Planctomicrobium piriforme]|uniref:Pyridoxal-dependent decarboxylase conserved domain-containing protein n=1 Tax=Planctomicrobium piriforme TaxID=1576369 RepID=A0A1I3BYG7_9PLAN|nr:pyridoxal-dependent decarboxylase [Planctomicrobium piriforme]SFH67408.1 Pyridoxal-dependent decarboxylase conserved domain-containing protein [Planctomicrobium piriforme]
MHSPEQVDLYQQSLAQLLQGFSHLPDWSSAPLNQDAAQVLQRTAERLHDNFPYHHPFYLGQMLKPPHPVAQMAYTLAMCLNPNNHALDGGRASSAMELECIAQLAAMFGWTEHLGHLCGGGTMANFEALWVARELTGGHAVAASAHAHYTHSRLSRVLNVPFVTVPVDRAGRMDLAALEHILQTEQIGTVVATLGTTGLGAVDPLDRIVALRERFGFRLHVDSAYGGYFGLAGNLRPESARAYAALKHADSIVIDPHKHGLQPYGCGCILFRDRRVAAIYHHESPYTYFTSDDLHLGEISLECSRAGASAVALWATLQAFPLVREGEFARNLERGREAALKLVEWIDAQPRLRPVVVPELDIVVWMVQAETASQSSEFAQQIFDAAARREIHLAQLTLSRDFLAPLAAIEEWDQPSLKCMRATVMKPEHLAWMSRILERLAEATHEVFASPPHPCNQVRGPG